MHTDHPITDDPYVLGTRDTPGAISCTALYDKKVIDIPIRLVYSVFKLWHRVLPWSGQVMAPPNIRMLLKGYADVSMGTWIYVD